MTAVKGPDGCAPPEPCAPEPSARDYPAPGTEVIARLKALVKETERRYASRGPTTDRQVTRLADQHFEHAVPTPHGILPTFSLTLPPVALPDFIPGPLATAWKVRPRLSAVVAMDIETAATVGGSRDVAFVIGMAWHDGSDLRLEQAVLRTIDDEPAALWAIDQRVASASHLVTYNGSRFDFPLLQRRYSAVRHESFAPSCDRVDLEPFARAAFGRRGVSSKLASLEERVLSSVRPAWTWHPVWREDAGLTWKRRRHLARILAKNGQDTLSLLVLLDAICGIACEPDSHPGACLFIGRSLEDTDPAEAARWYDRAAQGPVDDQRLSAALAAWRLSPESRSRLTPVLAQAAVCRLPDAWKAAEQLGLAAWRAHDRDAAVRWTECALRHPMPVRTSSRLAARLRKWTGGKAR